MRLAILGENRGPRHARLVEDVFLAMKPDHVVVLLRQGLGKVAHDLAQRKGIPVSRFSCVRTTTAGGHRRSRDGRLIRGCMPYKGVVELAVDQAVMFGKPDLVVCIAPRRPARDGRRHHDEMVQAFRARGVRCIVGRFDKGRRIAWTPA